MTEHDYHADHKFEFWMRGSTTTTTSGFAVIIIIAWTLFKLFAEVFFKYSMEFAMISED